jgi:hypothetical protein
VKHGTGFLLLAAWCLLLLQRLVCENAEEVKPETKFQSQAIVVLLLLALKDQALHQYQYMSTLRFVVMS